MASSLFVVRHVAYFDGGENWLQRACDGGGSRYNHRLLCPDGL